MGALLVHHLQGGLDQALAFLLSWHLLDLLCKSWLVNLQRKYISAESRLSRGEIRKCLETRLVPEVGIQEASHLVICCTFPTGLSVFFVRKTPIGHQGRCSKMHSGCRRSFLLRATL